MPASRCLRGPPWVALIVVLVAACTVFAARANAAATITVTNGADSGAGSLRDAIAAASPGDTIVVPALTVGLTSGQLVIPKNLTITGAGARSTTISGGNLSRVFFITAGTVTISGVTISGGTGFDVNGGTADLGGGVLTQPGTSLTIADSTLTRNSTPEDGGGVAARGTLSVVRSTLAGNAASEDGAGIAAEPSATTDSATFINDTFSNNTLTATTHLLGSALYINELGLANASATVTNDTLDGAGVGTVLDLNGGTGQIAIQNTIVFGHGQPTCSRMGPTTHSLGNNLEDKNLCLFTQPGDQVNTDPMLASPANNGGATDTEALLAGSPARDAGATVPSVVTDQRGVERPQPRGGSYDIGAYEFAPPIATTGAASSVAANSATVNGAVTPYPSGTAVFQYGTTAAYGAQTTAQSVASGNIASPLSAALTGLAPGTTFHYRVVATNADGTTFGADQTFTTAVPVPVPTAVAVPAAPPHITNATESNKTWSEGDNPKLVQVSRKRPPIGTTFKFTLDKAAAVRLDFTQPAPGRRSGGKCVAPTKRNKQRRKCTRTITRGTIAFAGHAGVNTVKFQGRLSKNQKLKPGKYTLVITATAPGTGSTSQKLTFTIVR